jgi:hypothetical protein
MLLPVTFAFLIVRFPITDFPPAGERPVPIPEAPVLGQLPFTVAFSMIKFPILEMNPLALVPVPIPAPLCSPCVLLPVTFAFAIIKLPRLEFPEAVPIPDDWFPPSAQIEPFTIARRPQKVSGGAPKPGPDPAIVTRLPAPIAPSVTFESSPQRTPPNAVGPSNSSVTTELEIRSDEVDETSRRRTVTRAFVMKDSAEPLPVTSTTESILAAGDPLQDIVPSVILKPSARLQTEVAASRVSAPFVRSLIIEVRSK